MLYTHICVHIYVWRQGERKNLETESCWVPLGKQYPLLKMILDFTAYRIVVEMPHNCISIVGFCNLKILHFMVLPLVSW